MNAPTLESASSTRLDAIGDFHWGDRFRTTRWSLVFAAASGGDEARVALGALYRAYFRPLVELIARQRGREAAPELAHAFFVEHLLDPKKLKKLELRSGGRFRGWLSVTLRTFLVARWRFERRQCRDLRRNVALGGDDEPGTHPASLLVARQINPEQRVERSRALALLSDALHLLEREYCEHAARGGVNGQRRFELASRVFLPGADREMISLETCAFELGLRLDTTKQLVGRLRQRYLDLRDRELRRRISPDLAAAKRWLYEALELPPGAAPES
jgi:hypothetical protein